MASIIFFIDALEPSEYSSIFDDSHRGYVESGIPKVTPKVTSEVYTGLSPSQNGMGASHSTGGTQEDRPQTAILPELLASETDLDVGSFFMPYSTPQRTPNQMWTGGEGKSAGENPMAQRCLQPPKGEGLYGKNMSDPLAFNARRDDAIAKVSAVQNAIRATELDVAFIGIRSIDEYTHYQWNEEYRLDLMKELERLIDQLSVNHEVLWWSDHGNQELKEVFHINHWLQDKGYLNIDVDLEFHERFSDEMEDMRPQSNNGPEVENILHPASPGVEIKSGSKAVSFDPYDSSIDILDDDLDEQQLIDDLENCEYIEEAFRTEEVWGEGRFMEDCPDILPRRKEHVLTSGNVHPNPIGMGYYRTGVHSKRGGWGTTDETFEVEKDVAPTALHDVIWEFITGEKLSPVHKEQVQNELVNNTL